MLKKSSNFNVVLPFGNVKSDFFSSYRGTFPKLTSSDKNYGSFDWEFIPFYYDGFTPLIILGLLPLTISIKIGIWYHKHKEMILFYLQGSIAVGFSYSPAPNPFALVAPVYYVVYFLIVGLFPFILAFLLFYG